MNGTDEGSIRVYLFTDTDTYTQAIVWTSFLLWVMICIKCKATGDVLTIGEKNTNSACDANLFCPQGGSP